MLISLTIEQIRLLALATSEYRYRLNTWLETAKKSNPKDVVPIEEEIKAVSELFDDFQHISDNSADSTYQGDIDFSKGESVVVTQLLVEKLIGITLGVDKDKIEVS